MENEVTAEEILRFQIKRNITILFKQYLVMLEDIKTEHDIALNKLTSKLPPEFTDYVELADYLTPEKKEMIRKKILTVGNDCYRAVEEQLLNYKIELRKKENE
jgi:hypothetical protein